MIPTTATTTMTITRRAAETTTAAAAGAAATAAASTSTSTSTYVSTPPAAAAPAASSTHRNSLNDPKPETLNPNLPKPLTGISVQRKPRTSRQAISGYFPRPWTTPGFSV